jgi:hypothetical protein
MVGVHLPLVGMFIFLLLLLWGLVRRSADVRQVALVGLLLSGLSTYPIVFAGEQAEDYVEELSGINEEQLEEHEEAGELAMQVALLAGVLAGLTALAFQFQLGFAQFLSLLTLAGVSSALGFMIVAAHEGGRIRHAVEMDAGPGILRSE